ncbi:DUF167 domain-containing protein [Limibaculum sp. M0105]|uniref:UPF0235 protein H0I76_02625 n=1 Tax=Thermohalobaculum xanthum TaxID=2753746 RepID=A0A8J7SC64_9RHOB|nr:DUF167 family protein [Thermohalobaculum xanthum]MBK0398071.1 DUF167 domain-containing protein [Thermohalobaculum xanthum]
MPEGLPWVTVAGGLRVRLRVTPKARRARIEGLARDAEGHALLVVKVTAPPADGAANAAVIAMVAKSLGVPKSAVTIEAGATSRLKTLGIDGPPEDLAARLEALLAG